MHSAEQNKTGQQDVDNATLLPPADEVGNYKIIRLLGSGATSNVYLGVDKTSMKLVAIKKIRPECAFRVKHKMFAIEASLCGKLNHPNIVALTMQTAATRTIPASSWNMWRENRWKVLRLPAISLPVKTVLDIARQAAEALNYAFQMGRDPPRRKPANMLMTQDGQVKLTDFGCALLDESGDDTNSLGGQPGIYVARADFGHCAEPPVDIYAPHGPCFSALTE